MGLYRRKDSKGKSKIFWMSFTVNGKQYQRSTETSDEKAAQRIWAKVQVQIAEGKFFDIDESRKRTFDEMMVKYLEEHSKVHKAISSYKKDKDLLAHLNGTFSGLSLNQITPRLLNEYKTMRLAEKAAPATVRNELRLLSNAFNISIRQWEWCKENPVSKISFKDLKARTIDRWLTGEEERRLMAVAEGKLHGQLPDIITVALHSGMSQEEILNLQWSKIDLFRRILITTRQKTNRTRTIPLNETLVMLFKRRLKVRPINGSGYVFFNSAGSKVDAAKLKAAFKQAVKDSKIAHCRFHDCRHTFATRLAQRGVDIYKISRLLGHKDISTTQRYAHHYPESLRDGVEGFGHFECSPKWHRAVQL